MIDFLLRQIFGSKHDRDIKRLRPVAAAITAMEPGLTGLSDADLRRRADELRARLKDGEGDELEEVLPEVFALVREAGRRALGMRHFDVQLMGGMVLHQGKIAEMATGEGKTLVATLPAVLNGLTGRGVHIVTVNDYLARRDTQWMGPLYRLLGLSVGVIQHEASFFYDPEYPSTDARFASLRPCTRREAYLADITYGTNNEFGFDYLRDNMRFTLERAGPAGAALRDRGRGRLDPDRRGPHAAHHLGPGRGVHRALLQDRPDHPAAHPRRDHHRGQAPRDRGAAGRRLHRGREIQDGVADRERHRPLRAAPRRPEPLRPGPHRNAPPRPPGPAGPLALQAGRGLHGQGRPGDHRRRVHRPPHARPAVVRRPSPGGGGQGRRADRAREPDAGHGHVPEPLPHVRQAGRHDRNRRHRGGRVRQDLQARRRRRPDQPESHPDQLPGRRLQDRAGEVRRGGRRDQGAERGRPAGPHRHGLDREVGAALEAAQEARGPAPGPEREVPREGGRDRRPGGAPRRGHDRHQHGGARHRHPARGQRGLPRQGAAPQAGPGPGQRRRGRPPEGPRRGPAHHRRGAQPGGRAGGAPHHRHRASRVPAGGQPAPRPLRPPGRPGLLAFLPLARGRPPPDLRLPADPEDHGPDGHGGRGSPSSTSW